MEKIKVPFEPNKKKFGWERTEEEKEKAMEEFEREFVLTQNEIFSKKITINDIETIARLDKEFDKIKETLKYENNLVIVNKEWTNDGSKWSAGDSWAIKYIAQSTSAKSIFLSNYHRIEGFVWLNEMEEENV